MPSVYLADQLNLKSYDVQECRAFPCTQLSYLDRPAAREDEDVGCIGMELWLVFIDIDGDTKVCRIEVGNGNMGKPGGVDSIEVDMWYSGAPSNGGHTNNGATWFSQFSGRRPTCMMRRMRGSTALVERMAE